LIARLSVNCVYCGSDETEPVTIRCVTKDGRLLQMTAIHCDMCQSDYDPLDAGAIVRETPQLPERSRKQLSD
jgi:hypothetical protein